jgi:hypothetical protein
MTRTASPVELSRLRLQAQRLAGNPLRTAEDVVGWLVAVQAQDYAGAKWSLGQRARDIRNDDVDAAFNAGRILRTHVLRPTWHFVLPADIRWLLALTGPRVNAGNAYRYRQLELDERTLGRAQKIIAAALEGGRHRTRQQLADELRARGIEASGQRLAYIVMRAELDGLVCSGPLHGKQFTYALLDERAPTPQPFDRDEALAELVVRFFTNHGPTTARDFAWWSGSTVADATRGIEIAGRRLKRVAADHRTYWCAPDLADAAADVTEPAVHLLPGYDEYLVACRADDAAFHPGVRERLRMTADVLRPHFILLDGRLAGGWSRAIQRKQVEVTAELLVTFRDAESKALAEAAAAYGRFLGLPARLSVVQSSR